MGFQRTGKMSYNLKIQKFLELKKINFFQQFFLKKAHLFLFLIQE